MATGTGIGEFFVTLAVDSAEGNLNVSNLVQTFGALEISTLAEIGLLWELAVQLASITDAGIKASLGFEQFSMHTGLSAQELQKWQIVAQQAHASAEDVTGSVEALTKHLANLAVGIPDAALGSLQQLGISAFGAGGKLKDAFQILGEVRQRLGVITQDAGQQERILAGLGINANLRETLLLADEQFKTLAGTAHGMTGAQEESFNALRQNFVTIQLIAKDIAMDIAAWVANIDKASGSLRAVEGFFRGFRDVLEGKNAMFKLPALEPGQAESSRRFDQSLLYKLFFAEQPTPNPNALSRMLGVEPSIPAAVGGKTTVVHVDKHDTYNIHDAHDPDKVKGVIEQHWDDILGRKTIDGFDRQNNNGGY